MLVMQYASKTELRTKQALSNGNCLNLWFFVVVFHMIRMLVSSLWDC